VEEVEQSNEEGDLKASDSRERESECCCCFVFECLHILFRLFTFLKQTVLLNVVK